MTGPDQARAAYLAAHEAAAACHRTNRPAYRSIIANVYQAINFACDAAKASRRQDPSAGIRAAIAAAETAVSASLPRRNSDWDPAVAALAPRDAVWDAVISFLDRLLPVPAVPAG